MKAATEVTEESRWAAEWAVEWAAEWEADSRWSNGFRNPCNPCTTSGLVMSPSRPLDQ